MTYRFNILHRGDGAVRVTCGEHHADSERGLARKLVNAGAVDGPIEAGRAGRVDYRVASLHAFAAGTLREGEMGFSVATYQPHPEATVSPALQNAVSVRMVAVKFRAEERAGRAMARKAGKAAGDAFA